MNKIKIFFAIALIICLFLLAVITLVIA